MKKQKLCDERTPYKLERDHYYSKMQKLSGTPGTANAVMQRVSEFNIINELQNTNK